MLLDIRCEKNKSLETSGIKIEQASFNNKRFVKIGEEACIKISRAKLCFLIIIFGYVSELFVKVFYLIIKMKISWYLKALTSR